MFSTRQYECLYGLITDLSITDIAKTLDTTASNASATIAGIAKKLNISPVADKTVVQQVKEWVKDYIKNYEQTQEIHDINIAGKNLSVREAISKNTETEEPPQNQAPKQTGFCPNALYCIDIIKAEADKAYLRLGKAVVLNSYPSADVGLDTSSMIEKIKRYQISLEVLEEIGKIQLH